MLVEQPGQALVAGGQGRGVAFERPVEGGGGTLEDRAGFRRAVVDERHQAVAGGRELGLALGEDTVEVVIRAGERGFGFGHMRAEQGFEVPARGREVGLVRAEQPLDLVGGRRDGGAGLGRARGDDGRGALGRLRHVGFPTFEDARELGRGLVGGLPGRGGPSFDRLGDAVAGAGQVAEALGEEGAEVPARLVEHGLGGGVQRR